MEDEQQLSTARLGMEAEAFLSSNLGRYMLRRVDKLINEGTDDLIACEPGDIECNTKHRNQINVGALFRRFLHEAVMDGQAAYQQINEQDALS